MSLAVIARQALGHKGCVQVTMDEQQDCQQILGPASKSMSGVLCERFRDLVHESKPALTQFRLMIL